MADAKDFLFEIGAEEMPSAPLNNAVKQLGSMIAKGLDEAGLAHGEVRVISSPRRLAALVANVATATDEVHEVKRGPAANIAFDADGNATKAAQGFARQDKVLHHVAVGDDVLGVLALLAHEEAGALPIGHGPVRVRRAGADEDDAVQHALLEGGGGGEHAGPHQHCAQRQCG